MVASWAAAGDGRGSLRDCVLAKAAEAGGRAEARSGGGGYWRWLAGLRRSRPGGWGLGARPTGMQRSLMHHRANFH
ncbi:hypothetical protein ABZP36_001375 [Zizania latifolia]